MNKVMSKRLIWIESIKTSYNETMKIFVHDIIVLWLSTLKVLT